MSVSVSNSAYLLCVGTLLQVEKGAALFDQKYPGWFMEIDIKRLDQAFNNQNIIHFVLPGILMYARELGLDEKGVVDHGLFIPQEGLSSAEYRALQRVQTEAWILMVLKRRFEV